jgi:integrase
MKGDKLLPSGAILRRVSRNREIGSVRDFPTQRLAQRELDRILSEINHEDYKPLTSSTFEQFAKKWMRDVMIHHKPSTQRSERSVINVHLIPAFGSMAVREMSAEVLQGWVTRQTAEPKTVRNILTTLQTMWVDAKEWGHTRSDFPRLHRPTAPKGNVYHFSVEETLAIIAKAKGWHRTFFRILAETGIRPGELAGLKRSNIGPHSIAITQSVWQRHIQTPKTQNAVRQFAISSGLAEEIRRHIEATEGQRNPHGLVFTAESGRPLSMDNFRNRVLNPILESLGIKEKMRSAGVRGGNYAFRHGNATLMDSLRIPLKVRQQRLGHADPNTTLVHYTHTISEEEIAAAEQIGAMLSPGTDETVQ